MPVMKEDPHYRRFIQAQQCWYLPRWTLCGEVERASSATLSWLCQTAPVALSSPAPPPRRRRCLYLKISEIEKSVSLDHTRHCIQT